MKKSNEASNDKNEIQSRFFAGPSESLVAFSRDGISHNGNSEIESSDNLADLYLYRLFSDFNDFDGNFEIETGIKGDSSEFWEFRPVDEINPSAFDQNNSSNDNQNIQLNNHQQMIIDDFTGALNEELIESVVHELQSAEDHIKTEFEKLDTMVNELDSEQFLNFTPDVNETNVKHFTFDATTVRNYEHDYSATSNPLGSFVDTPTPSPALPTPRRTSRRTPIRTSSRLQSRAKLISFDEIFNENVISPAFSETSSTSSRLTRRRSYSTKTDEQNGDSRSSYLERRRKNNEASKISRAARKQRYDEMDAQCIVYEKHNGELREKIETLETVTAALRQGLISNYQRRSSMGNS